MSYNIVTIEREYGAGGTETGQRVAEMLGVPCYGREVLEMAAARREVSPEYLEQLEEKVSNSLLYSLYMLSQTASEKPSYADTQSLYLAQAEVVQELASKGGCVFVGRCAALALAQRADVLNAFIYADRETRRRRAIDQYGDAPEKAEYVMKRFDKRRADFYRANAQQSWNDKANYHMMLDSGKLGLQKCAETIVGAVMDRG